MPGSGAASREGRDLDAVHPPTLTPRPPVAPGAGAPGARLRLRLHETVGSRRRLLKEPERLITQVRLARGRGFVSVPRGDRTPSGHGSGNSRTDPTFINWDHEGFGKECGFLVWRLDPDLLR